MLKVRSLKLVMAGLLSGVCGSLAADIQVKAGDKIAFMGDTISRRVGYPELVMKALKANNINAKAIYTVRGGDRSCDIKKRLQSEVLKRKPQILFLSCGLNDVWHVRLKRGVTLEQFKSNMIDIVDRVQQANIKLYLFTQTMIQENPQHRFNQQLAPYNAFIRQLAQDKKIELIDADKLMRQELQAMRTKYPKMKCNFLTTDGVHMNPRGDMMLATAALQKLGLSEAQIKNAWPQWKNHRFNYRCFSFTFEEFLKLTDRAYRANKQPIQLINAILQKHLATF